MKRADWNSIMPRTPYFVIPRLAIEAMPQDWQDRFAHLIEEADEMGMETPSYFVFRDKDEPECDQLMLGVRNVAEGKPSPFYRFHGRSGVSDPWANYRYGDISKLCSTYPKDVEHE